MGKVPETSSYGGADRDLVRFYSRLTRSLEEHCGSRELSLYLSGLRRTQTGSSEDLSSFEPALFRFFRRLGLFNANEGFAQFLPGFLREVAEAVSRPEPHIFGLMRAQVLGIEELSIKPVCGAAPFCRSCGLTKECDYYNNPRKPEMAILLPAERLLAGSDDALSDSELLSVALFGEKATGLEPLAASLFNRYGRLRAIFNADPHEYSGMRDISRSQVLRLASISALYRRLLVEKRGEIMTITCAKDLYDRYAPELRDYKIEAAVLVMLDGKNGVVRDAWFCEGSTNVTHLGLPVLLRTAVQEAATSVALVHNHPSGNPSPSAADRDFTRRLRSACESVGIHLIDHVIVTERGFFSFAEEAALEI